MQRRAVAVLSGALLIAAAGCAKPRYVRAVQATAPWRELTTAHFALATDLPDPQATRVTRELEEYLAVVIALMLGGGDVRGEPIPVIVFATGTEFQEYFQSIYNGVYVTGLLDGPVIVTGGYADAFYDGIARHELAHYVADQSFRRRLPVWLAEGIATFFETITADRERRTIVMGRASWGRVTELQTHGLLATSVLFAGEPDARDKALVDRYYATCWLLVHYLVSDQGPAFEAYQRRLRDGAPADEAWEQSFPADLRNNLDKALAAYFTSKRYEISWRRAWRAPAVDVRARAMVPSEVLATRALAYAAAGRFGEHPPANWRQRAKELAAQVLQEQPTNARALRIREIAEQGREESLQ